MKLCIDCKWCECRKTGLDFAICTNPRNTIVTGAPFNPYKWPWCWDQRADRWPITVILRKCGRQARWFEPRLTGKDSNGSGR